MSHQPFDAVILVSFGGPESRDEVIPFLENVLRGKSVPRERMLEVAEHYYHFDGRSPINAQNRELRAEIERRLAETEHPLPVYWGNRNWHPMLADTLRKMRDDGIHRALAFVTSAFGSYSGCRQYLEDIERARAEVGPDAPAVEKLRLYFNHPDFITAQIDLVRAAFEQIGEPARRGAALLFSAHSIPLSQAQCAPYERQLREAAQLIAQGVNHDDWTLVWQSRSGPPSQPWLAPDVCDHLRRLAASSASRDVVLVPLGFLSDHMEVLYDLDLEARQMAEELGLRLVRAATVSSHRQFGAMIVDLIAERLENRGTRAAVGPSGAWPDDCPAECCPRPARPGAK